MSNIIDDFNKIKRVIVSCENMNHINIVRRMYTLFCRKYPLEYSIFNVTNFYNTTVIQLRDRLICLTGEQAIHVNRRDLMVAPAHCDCV